MKMSVEYQTVTLYSDIYQINLRIDLLTRSSEQIGVLGVEVPHAGLPDAGRSKAEILDH